jgi:hypothetical protein
VVTVPVGAPERPRVAGPGEVVERPRAVVAATSLLLSSGVPFLLLGLVAAALPERRWMPYTGPWPRVHAGPLGYRGFGVVLALAALSFVVLVVLAHRRAPGARVAVVAAVALADPALTMVLLADTPPRPGWLLAGGAAVLVSLAGVVCAYRPEVDRWVAADQDRHATG